MKRKLIILFDAYPFETGEYSFVRTELEKMVEQFEVHMISVSPSTRQKMPTDGRITVHHCIRRFGVKEKLCAVIKFFFSSYGLDEIKQICKSRENKAGRFYDSVVYFGMADQLRTFVKKNRILCGDELIYSYWFNPNCLAFLMEKRKYPDMKVVSRIHGYDLYNERNPHGRQPFRAYMDRMVDHLFFVADAGLQYYTARWGRQEDIGSRYSVAPIGTVNADSLPEREQPDEGKPFHIVSCSAVIPLKRVNLIVEGLAQIADMPIRWTHFGAGSHYEGTKAQAAELLAGRDNIACEMPGFVPIEEIMQFYASQDVDCFITASSTEGCPVSVQEAMSYGIPVIATAVGEIPNMIDGNGILLPENPSPEEIAGAITELSHVTEGEAAKMRERSRTLWEKKYNALVNAEKFVECLKR